MIASPLVALPNSGQADPVSMAPGFANSVVERRGADDAHRVRRTVGRIVGKTEGRTIASNKDCAIGDGTKLKSVEADLGLLALLTQALGVNHWRPLFKRSRPTARAYCTVRWPLQIVSPCSTPLNGDPLL